MYCQDTLQRLNQREVDKHYAAINEQVLAIYNEGADPEDIITCDFCDQPAEHYIPVYNPADAVRGVEGAYSGYDLCEDCRDQGYPEETFCCEGCGELFVTNHSWDVLYTDMDGSLYCQACALEEIEPVRLDDCIWGLINGNLSNWLRINNYPEHEELWSGEFSEGSDFPGHTSLDSVVDSIRDAAEEKAYGLDTLVVPLITQGYQFSVVLGVFVA